jgi:hypothetical protein
MAAEGQLGVGATLSMEEIMQRLVDQAQFDLQVGGRAGAAPTITASLTSWRASEWVVPEAASFALLGCWWVW